MTSPTFQVPYAGFISRSIAFVIDLFVIGLSSLLFAVTVGLIANFFSLDQAFVDSNIGQGLLVTTIQKAMTLLVSLVNAFFGLVYLLFFWLLFETTPGKAIFGLRIVRNNGQRLNFGRALLRAIGYWISAVFFFLGFIWVLFDNRRQGWHDKIAGTSVVYSWPDFSS